MVATEWYIGGMESWWSRSAWSAFQPTEIRTTTNTDCCNSASSHWSGI